jgi:hypothetical protein
MPGVNRQGQAHIVSTAIRLPRSYESGPEVGTWFSIDPQPASISATINISIVFICTFFVDCSRIIRHPAIKRFGAILPFPEIAFVPVHLDQFAIGIVNADHGIMSATAKLRVADCVADPVRLALPRATEWEQIGN